MCYHVFTVSLLFLFSPPGAIFDMTDSYTISFIASGCMIAAGGLLCLPIRRIARWEDKRANPTLDIELEMGSNCGSAYLPVPEHDRNSLKDKIESSVTGIRFQADELPEEEEPGNHVEDSRDDPDEPREFMKADSKSHESDYNSNENNECTKSKDALADTLPVASHSADEHR